MKVDGTGHDVFAERGFHGSRQMTTLVGRQKPRRHAAYERMVVGAVRGEKAHDDADDVVFGRVRRHRRPDHVLRGEWIQHPMAEEGAGPPWPTRECDEIPGRSHRVEDAV